MSRLIPCSLSALVLVAACSTPPGAGDRAARIDVETNDADDALASGQEPVAAEASAAAPAKQDEARRAEERFYEFWKDPEFQRRFTESYLRDSDVEPPMTAREVELMEEVLLLMDDKEMERAMSRLQSRQGRGSSATIDFTLANMHFQRDELAEAAKEYEVAVDKYPKFRRAWKNLALVQMRLGDYPKAAASFVRVINLGGGDALTYGLLAFAHANAEDHVAAESAYRLAAMMEPERLDWRMGLARSFFKQRRYGEAASLCGALIAQNPGRADLWMLQANAFVGLGETEKAAEDLELVDKLGESTFASRPLPGHTYVNDKRSGRAGGPYPRAVRLDEKGDHSRVLLAANQLAQRSAYEESKRLVEGIEAAYADVMDNAAKKEVLKLRARLALATGAGDEEAAILAEVVKLDPLDGDALILLGQYHARRGETEKAILRYQQAAEIEAFTARAKVTHAQLLAGEGRYNEALPLLRAAVKLDPKDHIQKFLDDVEKVAGRSQ